MPAIALDPLPLPFLSGLLQLGLGPEPVEVQIMAPLAAPLAGEPGHGLVSAIAVPAVEAYLPPFCQRPAPYGLAIWTAGLMVGMAAR